METKTGKITSVQGNGTWQSPNGLFYKWEVAFDNGDAGGCMTKEQAQKRYVVGETITYTKEVKGNFTNIKRVEEKPSGGGFKSGGSAWTPEKERSVMIQGLLKSIIEAGVDRKHWETFLTEAIALHDKLTKGFAALDQKAEAVSNAFASADKDGLPF